MDKCAQCRLGPLDVRVSHGDEDRWLCLACYKKEMQVPRALNRAGRRRLYKLIRKQVPLE